MFRGNEVTRGFQIDLRRVFGDLEVHPILELVTAGTPDEVRIMQRTTIMGDYGLGRQLGQKAA